MNVNFPRFFLFVIFNFICFVYSTAIDLNVSGSKEKKRFNADILQKFFTGDNIKLNHSCNVHSIEDQYDDTICVPEDFNSIQHAIDAANAGTIILVSRGTYYENINLNGKKNIIISSNILLTSNWEDVKETIINGGYSDRVFKINSGEDKTTVLNGFTITNGYRAGGSFSSDEETGQGAGIYISNASPKLSNLIITDNEVENWREFTASHDIYGAGIYLENSDSEIYNCLISYNYTYGYYKSAFGGGIAARSSTNLKIVNCSFINNTVKTAAYSNYARGGGLYCLGTAEIENCLFDDNDAYETTNDDNEYGGGIYAGGADLEIKGTTFNYNGAYEGAGVFLSYSQAEFDSCRFYLNSSHRGGGIYITNSNDVKITRSVFAANVANYGGVFYCNSKNLIINNNTFFYNYGKNSGTIIYNKGSATFNIVNSIFLSNQENSLGYSENENNNNVDYSCFYGNYSNYISGAQKGDHLIYEDPELSNPDYYDFVLSSTSPCINTGKDVGLPFVGEAPDIGAIESQVIHVKPEVTSPDSIEVTEFDTLSYVATATCKYNSSVTFEFRNLPSWISQINENTLQGIPLQGNSDTCFTVLAIDGTLSDTLSVNIKVTPITTPVIISENEFEAWTGEEFSFSPMVKEENENITFEFQNLPTWLSDDENEISGIPPEGIGYCEFKVIAHKYYLSDTMVVNVSVFRSEDFTNGKWIDLSFNSDIDFRSICFIDEMNGWLLGYSNDSLRIFRTRTKGKNWEPIFKAKAETAIKIIFTDSLNGWFIGGDKYSGMGGGMLGSNYYYTNDGGTTWAKKDYNKNGFEWFYMCINDIFPINSQNLWIAQTNEYESACVINKSSDGGENWEEQLYIDTDGADGSTYFSDICFFNENLGWIVGQGYGDDENWDIKSVVFQTNNGGKHWKLQYSEKTGNDFSNGFSSICFVSSKNGWVESDNGILKLTEDGGETWKEVYDFQVEAKWENNFDFPIIHFLSKNIGWNIVEKSLYSTRNGGYNWNNEGRSNINNLFVINAKNNWFVGEHGAIWFYGDLGSIVKPPEIISSDSVLVHEDTYYEYLFELADTTTFTEIETGELPNWIHFTKRWYNPENYFHDILTIAPTEGNKDTTLIFIANNGYYTDTLKLFIDVIPVNDPPQIINLSDFSFPQNLHYKINLDTCVSDPDNETSELQWQILNSYNCIEPAVNQHNVDFYSKEICTDSVQFVVTDPGGLADTMKIKAESSTPVNSEIIKKNTISVYPNPTSGVIHIRSNKESISSVALYSIDGKLLFQKPIRSNFYEVLNLKSEGIKRGIYLLKIQTNNYTIIKELIHF